VRLVTVPAGEFGGAALAVLAELLTEFTQPVVALPTGMTPVPVYEEMVRQGFAFPAGAKLFALDEYCYPEPHPSTNAAYFRGHLPSVASSIVLPGAHAADASAEIDGVCQALHAAGGLDVAVVGIGANGHLGFNEPGSSATSPCRAVDLTAATQAQVSGHWRPPPTRGMTLGMDEILSASKVLLLARGAAKAAILAAAFEGDEGADVPASWLQRHKNLTVVCDAEAAAGLRR